MGNSRQFLQTTNDWKVENLKYILFSGHKVTLTDMFKLQIKPNFCKISIYGEDV